jgi:hypothetical protein
MILIKISSKHIQRSERFSLNQISIFCDNVVFTSSLDKMTYSAAAYFVLAPRHRIEKLVLQFSHRGYLNFELLKIIYLQKQQQNQKRSPVLVFLLDII